MRFTYQNRTIFPPAPEGHYFTLRRDIRDEYSLVTWWYLALYKRRKFWVDTHVYRVLLCEDSDLETLTPAIVDNAAQSLFDNLAADQERETFIEDLRGYIEG